jgi:hypothetical protein
LVGDRATRAECLGIFNVGRAAGVGGGIWGNHENKLGK